MPSHGVQIKGNRKAQFFRRLRLLGVDETPAVRSRLDANKECPRLLAKFEGRGVAFSVPPRTRTMGCWTSSSPTPTTILFSAIRNRSVRNQHGFGASSSILKLIQFGQSGHCSCPSNRCFRPAAALLGRPEPQPLHVVRPEAERDSATPPAVSLDTPAGPAVPAIIFRPTGLCWRIAVGGRDACPAESQ